MQVVRCWSFFLFSFHFSLDVVSKEEETDFSYLERFYDLKESMLQQFKKRIS